MAKPVECTCDPQFTCGVCLAAAADRDRAERLTSPYRYCTDGEKPRIHALLEDIEYLLGGKKPNDC